MASAHGQFNVRGSTIHTGTQRDIITAAEANQLKTTGGKVGQVIIANVGTTATLDIYDDPSTTNNKIFEWVSADGKGIFALQCPMVTGIRVVTGGTFGRAVVIWE